MEITQGPTYKASAQDYPHYRWIPVVLNNKTYRNWHRHNTTAIWKAKFDIFGKLIAHILGARMGCRLVIAPIMRIQTSLAIVVNKLPLFTWYVLVFGISLSL